VSLTSGIFVCAQNVPKTTKGAGFGAMRLSAGMRQFVCFFIMGLEGNQAFSAGIGLGPAPYVKMIGIP
jgi:hypothetical protein